MEKRKSIITKVSILYLLLTIINISLLTVMAFENQIDLITENARKEGKLRIGALITALERMTAAGNANPELLAGDRTEFFTSLERIAGLDSGGFLVFEESGKVAYRSRGAVNPATGRPLELPGSYMHSGMKAIAERDFTGRRYFMDLDDGDMVIHCYIPLNIGGPVQTVLYRPLKMDLKDKIVRIYLQVIVLILAAFAVHILFAAALFRVLIRPIRALYQGSVEIARGNLGARVAVTRDDEIGTVEKSFNSMAASIGEKIGTMQSRMKTIESAKKRIEKMTVTDELTGLYNRRYLFKRLEDEINISRRNGTPIGFALIDIDHFKKVNDTWGHDAGDHVLRGLGRFLHESCRNVDIVARYGGEEFAILFPDTEPDGMHILAERIREEARKRRFHLGEGGECSITLSIGLAAATIERETKRVLNRLVRDADNALYRAKNGGRNRTVLCETNSGKKTRRGSR